MENSAGNFIFPSGLPIFVSYKSNDTMKILTKLTQKDITRLHGDHNYMVVKCDDGHDHLIGDRLRINRQGFCFNSETGALEEIHSIGKRGGPSFTPGFEYRYVFFSPDRGIWATSDSFVSDFGRLPDGSYAEGDTFNGNGFTSKTETVGTAEVRFAKIKKGVFPSNRKK